MSNFGNNLRELRKINNLSQEQLAKILGVHTRSISNWELNQNEPTLDLLIKLSKKFEISYEDLLL